MVVQHRFPLLLRKLDPETSISTPVPTRLFHRGSDYSHPRNLYSHARNPYSHPPGIFIHIAPESLFTCPGIRNQWHGNAFDYLRNEVLDANNWYNGFTNNPSLPKAKERQNDFGGTLSGPILKDRTFFFFSYEGLRLRLPQTTLTTVPDLNSRQNAVPAMRPYLNAYPLPNGADFACWDPITTAFSRRVGQILAEVPAGMKIRPEYRFYM